MNSDLSSAAYFQQEGLDSLLGYMPSGGAELPRDGITLDDKTPYPPDLDDLARLHNLVRTRKVLTILEFGVGFSTMIMADALAKNRQDHERELNAMKIRCLHPFKIFSVDADEDWILKTEKRIRHDLKEHVVLVKSDVYIGTFNDRLCHYYKNVPDVVPDFIYLDGPGGHQVQGALDGSSFSDNLERTVVAADVLRLEPTLVPGLMVVIDGRTNNARFLKNNLQRNWTIFEDAERDVSLLELTETPLGIHNRTKLKFHGLLP
jgi:hypothetical protein